MTQKLDKKHLQGLKNLRKHKFEWFRSEFRRKSFFEQKKSPNLLPNTEIFDIFEISKFVWWPEMSDGRLKIGRKVRSK